MTFALKSIEPCQAAGPVAERRAATRHICVFVLPGANMLDFTALIEPLRVLNQIKLSVEYTWSVVSETGAPAPCSNGMSVPVDGGLSDTRRSDVIVVCSGERHYLGAGSKALQWLRRHARFGGDIVALSTGAFTLARAGLVDDRPVTLHWSKILVFQEMFPLIECEATRLSRNGLSGSGAGGGSSLELALSMIEKDFDPSTAQNVAEHCLFDFDPRANRPQRRSVSTLIGTRHPAILNILQKMEQSIENPVTLNELMDDEQISRRQLERLFTKHLKTSPARYYRHMRLDRARTLLWETDLPIAEIAVATGFGTLTNFARLYRARFGSRPTDDRKAQSA